MNFSRPMTFWLKFIKESVCTDDWIEFRTKTPSLIFFTRRQRTKLIYSIRKIAFPKPHRQIFIWKLLLVESLTHLDHQKQQNVILLYNCYWLNWRNWQLLCVSKSKTFLFIYFLSFFFFSFLIFIFSTFHHTKKKSLKKSIQILSVAPLCKSHSPYFTSSLLFNFGKVNLYLPALVCL
jgi:hypothetical protein